MRKGQSLLEYCVFIFCLVAALIAMQVYLKRGIQGQIRRAADDIGEQFDALHTTYNITQRVDGLTYSQTSLSRVLCEGGREDHCIDGIADLNKDGKIDDEDYVSVTQFTIWEDYPEYTERFGYERIAQTGGLYD